MTKDEALRMALEALEDLNGMAQFFPDELSSDHPDVMKAAQAITAIKDVLAQPEQEPVAWMYPDALCDKSCLYLCTKGFTQFPECATPPQQSATSRKPLTDEQRNWIVATCPTPRHIIDTVEKMHGIKE